MSFVVDQLHGSLDKEVLSQSPVGCGVAISPRRILALDHAEQTVTFIWKDFRARILAFTWWLRLVMALQAQ